MSPAFEMHRKAPRGLTGNPARSIGVWLMGATLLALGQVAQAEDADVAAPGLGGSQVSVELVESSVRGAGTAAPLAAPLAGATGAGFTTSTQTMLWANRGRMALGVGVEQPWQLPARLRMPEPAGPYADRRMVVGLGVNTGVASRLSWQTSVSTNGEVESTGPTLVLKRSDPVRALARGAFRMELSKDTAISIRPRGRRVGIALSSQW